MNDLAPLHRAVALACESVAAGGGPFGAVVTRDGIVLAEGVNEVTLAADPTAHAEIVAIRRACRALGRFDLAGYVIHSSCEPCPMCLGAIHWARLDRVVYAADRHDAARAGFDDAVLYEEVARPPASRRVPAEQRPVAEATAPFAAWTAKADRRRY